MKALVIVPFRIWPPHFGSCERTYNLARQLARSGEFELFLFYTDYSQVIGETQKPEHWANAVVKGFGPSRRWAQILNLNIILNGLRLIVRERPNLILCEHLWSALHVIILHILSGVPFVFDNHNAEYVRFQRMGKKSAWFIRILEKITCFLSARVICVSEADKTHLTKLGVEPDKISVVYNAIDTQQYRPNPKVRQSIRETLGMSAVQPLVLFFGKLDYQPNVEAIEIIAKEIAPRALARNPNVRFVVCGYNPPIHNFKNSPLIFTGLVPKIEDYINASDVVIAPLISGGGTKLKIVQALACGKPVVTTSVGAEGIQDVGPWMQITDDWEAFVELIFTTLSRQRDFPLADLNAFRHAYSWSHMMQQGVRAIKTVFWNHI